MKPLFILAPVFSDFMVFQANKPIKIFGTCKKGSELIITFPHQVVKIKARTEEFLVEIAPMGVTKQGFSFSVASKKQVQTIYNCLVGEVFLIAGEANVSFPLKDSFISYIKEIPPIRYYKAPNVPYRDAVLEYPKHFSDESGWMISNKDNAVFFSAIGYFISIGLFENLQVPIGIISVSQNDASIFSFIDEKELLANTKLRRIIIQYQKEQEKYKFDYEYNSLFEQELSYLRESSTYRNLPMGPKHFNRPAGLLDLMKRTIIPYSIKGIIWYQGESDWDHVDIYKEALEKFFDSIRFVFDQQKLPIYYVQLAGYTHPGLDIHHIPKIREAQAACMNIADQIYMTSAIDYGDPEDIVPKDKFPIAERITNLILEKTYKIGKNTLSPSYFSYQVNKDSIVIYTQYNLLNLVSKSMKNLGFYYSTDRISFAKCKNVKIVNNQIIISNIKNVKIIHYGYENYPLMDIYSSNGLPLLPFKISIDI